MSIGGPSLGTLLVQRLDAMLGTTLSQQTNLASGARPNAVGQPDSTVRAEAVQRELTRHPREIVDKARLHSQPLNPRIAQKARLDPAQAGQQSEQGARTGSTPSAPTTLGGAARAILALLNLYPEQAPPIRGKAPLATGNAQAAGSAIPTALATPATPATPTASATPAASPAPTALASTFAQALASTLQDSGLFYESHLNAVTAGKESLETLAKQPQATLSHAQTPSQTGPLQGLHPETHLLVRQQLEVLANQTVFWRGEAWPDAPMEWEVQRHHEDEASGQPAADAGWASRITINLPALGTVEARLTLHNDQVLMHLIAPEAQSILQANSHALREKLEVSGLQLSQLSIHAQP